ncbi:MAG: hypothetical protein JNN04_04235 [Cyclobacteriaceae bacterium]|nr:hypothetical protein [Cyclobacteriaceae bacterium]
MKNTPFGTEAGIFDVVAGFRDRTLPKEKWTHEAHLVTAIWFHVNHTPEEAICYLRSGIITYNDSVGGKNTPTDGYHETMTLFWCRTISAFVAANRQLSLVDLCARFLASEQATKEYPLRFYSREVLFSAKARAIWVAPDRASLDF